MKLLIILLFLSSCSPHYYTVQKATVAIKGDRIGFRYTGTEVRIKDTVMQVNIIKRH